MRGRGKGLDVERGMQNLNVPEDAARFLKARLILAELRGEHRAGRIDIQQYRTLRGQALAGDIDGAVRGLARIEARNRGGGDK